MPRICVKPAEGRSVRSPDHNNTFLPPYGDEVTDSVYWQRRRQDGDIESTTIEAIEAGRLAEQEEAARVAAQAEAAEQAAEGGTPPAPRGKKKEA